MTIFKLVESAPESDKKYLLSELELMKTLKPHPHVIKLLGCVTDSGKTRHKFLSFNTMNVLISLGKFVTP